MREERNLIGRLDLGDRGRHGLLAIADVLRDRPRIQRRLFKRARNPRLKVRLVGVRASNLERAPFERNLFEAQQREKLDRLYEAADKLRDRFGFDAVQLARSLDPSPKAGSVPRKPKSRRQFLGRED